MSDVWNEGYFTEVGYTYGYYRDVSPSFQRFCLLLKGFEATESNDPNHCELGFGQGVSVNIHAAASPGHFYGNDFTPSHAAHAIKIAAGAASDALLTDDSFEQFLARDDLPQFDSISLHGIWTWISPENRHFITEFIRRYLKPGGTVYVSYNCFPGWSPAYPLRHLFAQYNRYLAPPLSPEIRVGNALDFTKSLLAAKPAYSNTVVGLEGRLDKVMEQNRAYLAHEYFNREWNCMYFTDVVDELSAAKLDFASTAVPLDNVDAVNLTKEGQEFLATIPNPILREQARDYFVNQQFRKDLFMRGAVRLNANEQRRRLLNTRFVLIQRPADVPSKIRGSAGEAELVATLYQPVLEVLASRNHVPKTLQELTTALPDLNNYQNTLQVITVLLALNVVFPCQPEEHARTVKKKCDALNRYLCEQARFNGNILVLASAVTGTGVPVDRFSMLFLLAPLQKQADPVAFAWQTLRGNNEVLIKDGVALQGEEANVADLKERYARFVSNLPILKALGIA